MIGTTQKGVSLLAPRRRKIAEDAGPAPEGALGGEEVLAVDRNLAETGSPQPTVVTESMQEVGTAPGELASTGEDTDLSGPDPDENPAMVPDEPVEGEASLNDLFADYARANLGPQDTSEEEALIRELMEQQSGMDVYNQRASMGRAGFGSSGAMAGMEGDIQRRAAQAASQDILGLRRQAEEDAFGRAARAAGISLDEARFESDDAYRQAVLEAMQAVLGGQPPPPEDGGDGGGDPLDFLPDGPVKDALTWAGDVNADGKIDVNDLVSVRGAGAMQQGVNPAEAVTATNAGEVNVPTESERRNAVSVSSEGGVPQPSEDAGVSGADHYYWGADGNLYKVRATTMTGDY